MNKIKINFFVNILSGTSGFRLYYFQTTLFIPQSLKRFNHGFGVFRFGNGADDGE